MIIDVKQNISEKSNEFEVFYNSEKVYKAILPFINIMEKFNFERLREIKVYDLNNKLVYKTDYNYGENLKEEVIPLKYLVTKSQKFYQLKFTNENNSDEISIFFEMQEIFKGYNVIKYNDDICKCYSVEDGYVRHISIYMEDIQIAELIKSNVVKNGRDEYRIYLKDEYNYLKDAMVMLALYLDRVEYSSSYLKNNNKQVDKKFSYSKVNKYYDSNWIKNNFESDDYIAKINEEAEEIKKEVKQKFKATFMLIGIGWAICIIITIILLIILL